MVLGTLLVGCARDPELSTHVDLLQIPEGFPQVEFPEDNTFTPDRWKLGKRLFYETALSRDSSISCSSCHTPSLAFSDGLEKSLGVENRVGVRNAPSLGNVAYQPYFTREGGVKTLEMQVLVPIQEHSEFDFNIVLLAERLDKDLDYHEMAMNAYGRIVDPFVISRALATFERTLLTGNSKFDKFEHGETDLTEEEDLGRRIFFGEDAKCSSCHGGFNFTDYGFRNNGLYTEYADSGRMRLTGNEDDRALFKVPSLRNVGLTAPYMHDGFLATLEEVVMHYNSGGHPHKHKDERIHPLHLTHMEQRALVAFLNTLTDHDFTEDSRFQ